MGFYGTLGETVFIPSLLCNGCFVTDFKTTCNEKNLYCFIAIYSSCTAVVLWKHQWLCLGPRPHVARYFRKRGFFSPHLKKICVHTQRFRIASLEPRHDVIELIIRDFVWTHWCESCPPFTNYARNRTKSTTSTSSKVGSTHYFLK